MLDLKNSPLSKTPTKLPVIPGITLDDDGKIIEEDEKASEKSIKKLNGKKMEEQNGHDPKKGHGMIVFLCLSFFEKCYLYCSVHISLRIKCISVHISYTTYERKTSI